MKIYLFLILLTCRISIFSQNNKLVLNTEDNKPVSFAEISFNNGTGAVCDINGILKNEENNFDSVKIFCLGYKTLKMSKNEYDKSDTIFLVKDVYTYPEVVVSDKKIKSYILGNKKHSYAVGGRPGDECALLITNNYNDIKYIKKINVFIKKGGASENARFRIKLYEVNSNGFLGKQIKTNDIIVNYNSGKKGWVSVDVSENYIPIDSKGIIVSVQWLPDAVFYNTDGSGHKVCDPKLGFSNIKSTKAKSFWKSKKSNWLLIESDNIETIPSITIIAQ
jgi:hypothetical protein